MLHFILLFLLALFFLLSIGHTVYIIFDIYRYKKDSHQHSVPERESYDNDIQSYVIYIINDIYSPFINARLCDHLVSDLDFDSIDIFDILTEAAKAAGAKVSMKGLYERYGKDPTIAQLCSYIDERSNARDE